MAERLSVSLPNKRHHFMTRKGFIGFKKLYGPLFPENLLKHVKHYGSTYIVEGEGYIVRVGENIFSLSQRLSENHSVENCIENVLTRKPIPKEIGIPGGKKNIFNKLILKLHGRQVYIDHVEVK